MSETDGTYNGWPNRATWAVNVWYHNEEGLYLQLCDILKASPRGADFVRNLRQHTEMLSTYSGFERMFDDIGNLSEVNWWALKDIWDDYMAHRDD